ncbi:hypothetical protein GY21_19960 [Cryobacterium roopkundense]|uniref:Secreted protein n=1 Tax=Cryobacterium roopkundense TaxID=1001240 RepID=A0A099J021_9MICO|nr:hypothetical protein [Cryobacterium roopkundense]KGJ71769.1 hypothetical protein GY21_19960 [Cryobacterium roopkundense]MBB5643515.1 hypothetical protein [Cryobacterium roopkundense]
MRIAALTIALLTFAAPAVAAEQPADSGGGAAESTSETTGVTKADGSTVFNTEQSQLTILPSTGRQPSEARLSVLAASISCNLNVQNVHGSTHVSGTINGVAVISCTAAAGSLTLHYSLIRVSPNYTQWGAGSKSNAGQKTLQNNRAVSCSEGPGNFQGWAQGVISPPPGYTLVGPATSSKYGNNTGVACGVSQSIAGNSESPSSETTTVTFVRSDLAG